MRTSLFYLLLAIAALSPAQSADSKRLDSIWGAIHDRLSRQADAWFKVGDYPRVVQILRFHYELQPSNYDVGTNLGWMYENVDEWDEAGAVYVELRKASPNDPDNAEPEAYFYYRRKMFAKVPPILEPTIKGHDPHPNNYRVLAEAYEQLKMYADSKRVWELYLSRHPGDGAAKAHLERILKKMKEGSPKKT